MANDFSDLWRLTLQAVDARIAAAMANIGAVGTTLPSTGGTGDVVGPAGATDGNLAVFDGGTGKLIKDGGAPSGAGGTTTYTSAYGSPPGSPAAGDLWLPTDSPYLLRYSGSAWIPWGAIAPMVLPVAGDFAWINQGPAALTNMGGALLLTSGGHQASDQMRILKRAYPGGTYAITARFAVNGINANFLTFGLCWRQSSDGKLCTCSLIGGAGLNSQKWSSPTTWSATYANPNISFQGSIWLRIAESGGNRICSFSNDGLYFTVFHSVGRTDFLTADEVGWFVDANNASWDQDVTLLSWQIT